MLKKQEEFGQLCVTISKVSPIMCDKNGQLSVTIRLIWRTVCLSFRQLSVTITSNFSVNIWPCTTNIWLFRKYLAGQMWPSPGLVEFLKLRYTLANQERDQHGKGSKSLYARIQRAGGAAGADQWQAYHTGSQRAGYLRYLDPSMAKIVASNADAQSLSVVFSRACISSGQMRQYRLLLFINCPDTSLLTQWYLFAILLQHLLQAY